jgi:hypothetical protein
MDKIAERLSLSLEELNDYRALLLDAIGVTTMEEIELLASSFSWFPS